MDPRLSATDRRPAVLVCDLDGTIVFDGEVPSTDAAALQAWTAAGNLLVLDTGKSVDATRRVWTSALPRPDYVIAFTGAVITDGDLVPLSVRSHDPALFPEVFRTVRDEVLALYASTLERDYEVLNRAGIHSMILPAFEPADAEWVAGQELFGIPLFVPGDADRARLAATLTDLVGDRGVLHRNQTFLDIVPAGATKGLGLRRLLADLVPDHGPVWTIGDSWNDLSMHAEADHPIALRHSPAEVLAACETAVGSAHELIDRLLTATGPGRPGPAT
ncbi:HAD family hydrolase [Raineyella sp. W15-4]|uniref:HAD family hydrolase n=1 Tax=Raineyella sp. W15-4 TaxID=3081651 RepID=UPI002953845E|nr:HAD hydrolase family protein [Raineyella sp. W15-4]WOQ17083.1 HAD hydrolase family protein [Raineyella sp. W15-4]